MEYPELTVGAVILNPKEEVLLCKSHKWDDKYVIPGGHVEYGEKLEDALRREVLEETGLEILSSKLLGIKECVYSNNFFKGRHFIFMDYLCKTDSTNVILNDEAEEFVWAALDKLHEYELGGFTESLLNKLNGKTSDLNKEYVYYNY